MKIYVKPEIGKMDFATEMVTVDLDDVYGFKPEVGED